MPFERKILTDIKRGLENIMIHPPLVRIDGWVIIFSSISDNGDGGGNGSGGREFIHHHDQYYHWSLCRYNDLPFQSYYMYLYLQDLEEEKLTRHRHFPVIMMITNSRFERYHRS